MAKHTQHALAISVLIVVLWAADLLPHALTGLIGCFLFWSLGDIPFSTAFGGFAHPAAWFVFAAGLFGIVTTKSGLARRLAYWVMGRLGTSYPRLILSFVLTSFALNLLVPSGVARVIILAGIALGVVKAMGWGPEALPARGLFVLLTASSTLFDKMMLTGGAAIVAQGIIEKVGQVPVYWSQWFFAHLPTHLLSIVACWIIILWLFPVRKTEWGSGESLLKAELHQPGPWSAAEKRGAIFLLAALGLWITDSLHRMEPAMVALGIGLIASVPRIGVVEAKELKKFDFLPFIFTASALSLGEVLTNTGVLNLLTQTITSWWQPQAQSFFSSAIVLYWSAFAYHLVVPSDPATLATSMPVVMNFSLAQKWNPFASGLVWTLATAGKIFIYQSGVAIVGYSYGYFQTRDFLKVGICITIAEFLILLLLVSWYWPLIGLIR